MRFCEQNQVVVGILPRDLDGGAASGDYVSLKNYGHIAIVVIKDAGDAGEDPVVTVLQATKVDGTGAKALDFTEYYLKDGTQTGVGTFTKTTQASGNTLTMTGENEQLAVLEFDAEDLDVAGGFDCLRVATSDPGSGTGAMGAVLYILSQPRYAAETMPSAIVD
jgi:hypothetical protein